MAQADTGDGSLLAYRARPQQAALHLDGTRFKVIVAHRRFGKTVFAILQLLLGAMRNERRRPGTSASATPPRSGSSSGCGRRCG